MVVLLRLGLVCSFIACAGRTAVAPKADPVVAEVLGERIRASQVDGMLHDQLSKLDYDYTQRRYDMRKQGLDALLFRKLVEHEAQLQALDGEAYLQREVESKLAQPDEYELRGFYLENADKLAPLTFDEVRPKLSQYLMSQRRSEAILGLYERLKQKAHPTIKLPSPEQQLQSRVERTSMSM